MTSDKLFTGLREAGFTAEECITIWACVSDGFRSASAGTFDPDNLFGSRTKEHLLEWTDLGIKYEVSTNGLQQTGTPTTDPS